MPTLLASEEMRLVIPNSHRVNRGNYTMKELADACRSNEFTDLIVLHEHRGIPGALRLATRFGSTLFDNPFQTPSF